MIRNKMVGCQSIKTIKTLPQTGQTVLIKDKHYFRPEEALWNNPYRSSNRTYKYYHAVNNFYENNQGVQVKRLQIADKENAQKSRIIKLINFRNNTRQNFKQRKRERKILQITSKSDFPYSSEKNSPIKQFNLIGQQIIQDQPKITDNIEQCVINSMKSSVNFGLKKDAIKETFSRIVLDRPLKQKNQDLNLTKISNIRKKIFLSSVNLKNTNGFFESQSQQFFKS